MKNIKLFLAVSALVFAVSFNISAQTLTSLDGEKINVANQSGKVVVLAIGASWLPLSKDQAGFTNKIANKFKGREVVVYFIATDSTSEKSKNFATNDELNAFATRTRLTVPILRDSDGAATLKKYAIDQIPSFVILGKDGKPATEAFGGLDPKSDISIPISQAIEKLL
ncbi:MAG: TlpA family protein disulfide reductase [Pyrinomonadaceae bacterium]|nr:TlpA family protein disulfide reductase [Pyrinomonadaceae bacterium]